jgi:hypothetical protein
VCFNVVSLLLCSMQMTGAGDDWGGSFDGSPTFERPPLRHIDKYVRPECPCCDMTKRFTVAVMASVGELLESQRSQRILMSQ